MLEKTKFHLVKFFKNEVLVGTIELIVFTCVIILAWFWWFYDIPWIEPITIIIAMFGGILNTIKRIIKAPKFPSLTFKEYTSKNSMESNFFMWVTFNNFSEAKTASKLSGKWIFLVIYDEEHSTKSELNYALWAFTKYEKTKRLLNDYFIQVILPSNISAIQKFIPKDYHMEKCLLVVLDKKWIILRQEWVYANSDEWLKRVNQDIEKLG